jgi:hypothetical protein
MVGEVCLCDFPVDAAETNRGCGTTGETCDVGKELR